MKNTTNNTTKAIRFPVKNIVSQAIAEYDPYVRHYKTHVKDMYFNGKVKVNVVDDTDWMFKAPVSMSDFTFFSYNANIFMEIFGEDIVARNLLYITMSDIAHAQDCTENTAIYYCRVDGQGRGMLVEPRKNVEITEYKGDWEKKVKKPGFKVIYPNPYFSVAEGTLIEKCLIDKYPFMKDFKFECYSFSRGNIENEEFYVKVQYKDETFGSLYVPYTALRLRSRTPIIERMTSYWGDYYKNRPELYEKAIAALDTEEALRFFDAIEHPETFKPINIVEEPEYELRERYKRYVYLLIKADECGISEPVQYETYTQAVEAMEEAITKLIEGGGNYGTDLDIKNGCATGYASTAKGENHNFKVYRMKLSKTF